MFAIEWIAVLFALSTWLEENWFHGGKAKMWRKVDWIDWIGMFWWVIWHQSMCSDDPLLYTAHVHLHSSVDCKIIN